MLGIAGSARAVTILEDYEVTSDLADVVHLGDDLCPLCLVGSPAGANWETVFELPASLTGPFTLQLDEFGMNDNFENHVFVNGHDLGFAETPGPGFHWRRLTFNVDEAFLNFGSTNTFRIESGLIGGNLDDFEFTNVSLVSEPGTALLFALGLVALASSRRRWA
jgi:hypothetical protein